MGLNIPNIWYVACFSEDDGIYSCDHKHPTVAEAMHCIVPDGGSFIRAVDAGVFRSLNEHEYIDFLEQLGKMPWSCKGALPPARSS